MKKLKTVQIVDYVKHSRSILMVLATVFAANSAMATTTYIGTGGGSVDCTSDALGSGTDITVSPVWCENWAPTNPTHTASGGLTAANGTCTYTATCESGYDGSDLNTYQPVCTVHDYTISYTLNSGTNAVANPATYNKESATIVLADASRDYYDFQGWCVGSGLTTCASPVNAASVDKSSITIATGSTGDKAFSAVFTPTVYTITYVVNDGTITGQKTTYTVEDTTFTLVTPTFSGYTFVGWCDDAGLTENCTTTKTVAQGSHGDITVYAKWQKNLTYSGDGIATSNDTCVYSDTIILPATPTRDGYTFAGWSVDK